MQITTDLMPHQRAALAKLLPTRAGALFADMGTGKSRMAIELAKIRAGDPPVAERFELYLGACELANGYHELTDATEQRTRFERDNARRRHRGQRELPLDERLLAALPHMPPCAGVALGIERLKSESKPH